MAATPRSGQVIAEPGRLLDVPGTRWRRCAHGAPARTIFAVASAAGTPGLQWIAPAAGMTRAECFSARGCPRRSAPSYPPPLIVRMVPEV